MSKKIYYFSFLLLITLFVFFKWEHLFLPYYWDEAWVYGPAIRMMQEHGISLSPNALPTYYSRGHPLLFHCFGAVWINLFGTSLFSTHCFALSISAILLFLIFLFCKRNFSSEVAISAVLIVIAQPIFLAQSALVLPEMLLSVFILSSLFFYIENKNIFYWITAACAVITKESAVVIFISLSIFELIVFLKSENKNILFLIKRITVICSPSIVLFVFLLWQKNIHGWFFFDKHIGAISFDSTTVWNKLENYFSYLFIYQSRNVISASVIITAILFFYKKLNRNTVSENKIILLFTLFIAFFLLFCSINFFSNRYVLCLIPPLAIIASWLIHTTIKKFILQTVFVAIIFSASLYHSLNKKSSSDHNLGYVEVIKSYQETVDFMIENKLSDKKIYAFFLMKESLTNPYSGYLNEKKQFTQVGNAEENAYEYFIFSNTEGEEDAEKIKQKTALTLIKRFENKHSQVEIYSRTLKN